MDKGQVFILQYIKNLEDQVLSDNYVIGKELVRERSVVTNLIDWLFHAKNIHELNEMAYDGYGSIERSIPKDWVKEAVGEMI